MAIKRPAEPPSPSSTAREAQLQLGRPHGDSRPHAVRPDRAGKEQGRPAREGWWSEALQGGMCAASAASSITAPAQQHVDMDWTWDARPGDGSQNSVQVAGGRYRVRPVVDRVNHARPHRRTRGLRDSMVLEGKADLQLPPGRAPSGRAASLGAARLETHDSSSYVALVCVKKHNARGQAHGLARDRAARCFDCMAEAGTAALAGHSPRVDAPPLRGRARRVADAGDGPAGTEKAIRRRCEPPSVADGDGRIHNIGMTFVYHSHIM